jgi:hypothetical protein
MSPIAAEQIAEQIVPGYPVVLHSAGDRPDPYFRLLTCVSATPGTSRYPRGPSFGGTRGEAVNNVE